MRTHDALLAAVIARPDEDTPRLAYADLLDEEGGESNSARAEFIRLQIERARLSRTDPRRAELQTREKGLSNVWAWEWAAPLHGHVSEWVFRRGFIEKVESYLETTADQIREMLNLAPVRHIRTTGQFGDLSGVVEALPALAGLRGLEFWGLYAVDDEDVRRMLTSPHLANLRTLILYHDRNGNMIDDGVIIEGLNSPHRANLLRLGVNIDDMWRGPSEAVLRAMVRSPHLRRVRRLKLPDTRLDGELVGRLFTAMPRLGWLDLGSAVAMRLAWQFLLERARDGKLKWLRLENTRTSERALNEREYGTDLTETEFRAAFDATPARIDWETTFIDPWNDGCWHGYEWDDLRTQQLQHFHRFLSVRDFDGLEAYFRALCVKFRGEDVAAQIEAVPFAEYTAALASALHVAVAYTPPATRSVMFTIHSHPGAPAEGLFLDTAADDNFVPRNESFGGDILDRFDGPPYPGGPECPNSDAPLDPSSGSLYLRARQTAAVARAALRANLRVPLVLGPYYHRVW